MAKPSGIKITDAIDRLARWFAKESGCAESSLVYMYEVGCGSTWILYLGTGESRTFYSFTTLRRWMEAEVKRRRILFRRF